MSAPSGSHRIPVSARTSGLIDDNENIEVMISVRATLVKDDDTIESLMKRTDTPRVKRQLKTGLY